MTPTRSQRGFTLGETLVTLAVAGASIALAVPGLQSLAEGNRQSTAVNRLVGTMHLARSEAITRNRPVVVCTSTDGERCGARPWDQGWIAWVDADGNGNRTDGEPLIDRVAGLAGLEVDSGEFTHSFSYRPNGRPMGETPDENSGEFAFCPTGAEDAARVVILRATGLPVLSTQGQDGSPVPCRRNA